MEIKLNPVAWLKNSRTTILDDNWGAVELIWHREKPIGVRMLDAINGTPVL